MKYTDFVKEVEKYGWQRTRFQGHKDSVATPVSFVHHNKYGEMDFSETLYMLQSQGSYDEMYKHMRNYDLFTNEKLKCTHCGGKVHYDELDPDENVQYTMKCDCSEFVKRKRWKAKIPDYWVEAKEEEVEA